MIDKKVQMMDAGMVLFTSEKPFGTVLGGIKAELTKLGKVKRANEISPDELPDTTGECDLLWTGQRLCVGGPFPAGWRMPVLWEQMLTVRRPDAMRFVSRKETRTGKGRFL